ncbi:MAG: TetR/AcrR family transcriptional regulator [Pseudomonadota bacterium]
MPERKIQRQRTARRTKTTQRVGPRTSRSELSRQRIIDAVITLIFRGQPRFGAVDVAKEAQIGLRTVFNHFDDMDSLYREMDAQVHQKLLLPIILRPFETTEWRDQVMEAAVRRAEVYEAGFPAAKFARSMQVQSIALREAAERGRALERSAVEAIIPKDLAGREPLVIALDAAFGFDNWAHLRDDAGLSAEEALSSLEYTARALLQQHDALHP